MPPKKREKDNDSSKNPRIVHMQADHELFLQAFEKPTQIYRYLRTRNMCSPIFLYRTLTYMRSRMSRTNKPRQGFKVNSITEKLLAKQKDSYTSLHQPGFINITFLGFSDQGLDGGVKSAQVETVLLKISHKKRKDNATSMEVILGTCDVPANQNDQELPRTSPTISISTESFNLTEGSMAKSFNLFFRVKIATHGRPVARDDDEPALKKRKSNNGGVVDCTVRTYAAQLTIYDKHNRCYLSDGDYDVILHDLAFQSKKNSPKKHSSWENVTDLFETCNNIDALMKGAVLKFKLTWSPSACASVIDRPKPFPLNENKENMVTVNNNNKAKLQIVYQFVYNNNSRQQTEACEDLHCPWCSLNCDQLYTLLKHLKLCHSRFTFTYVPIAEGARIDVAINELYDGSYTGSPHDLISQPSFAFSRNGPVKRSTVTHILVCHPKRSKPSLSEFLELDDCEYDGQRPFITGHNRLYHHTTTCLPIYPKEMDVDSEGENDPEWLRAKTMTMIDEFTDVNEGEKELMKMWNLHVMKYGFVGDCQIPIACQMFVQHKGKELLLKNLYKNFIVHMCSLFDFGLVSAVCLYTSIQKLQEMVGETGAIRNVLKESREAQMDNWSKSANTPISIEKASAKVGNSGRKTGILGLQRRKGNHQEAPARQKFSGEVSRRRLSLSLNKTTESNKNGAA